jgi:hypothetical protein
MLTFKIVKKEQECRNLWEKFSDKDVLWDLWQFRRCFHNHKFEFNFVLGVEGEHSVGVLPLVYDKEMEIYIYFGDMFPEQNKFLVKDKGHIKDFIENCPKGTSLYYVDRSESGYFDFLLGEKRYFLDLRDYGSFEDYINSFTKKHRKNIRYDLKKLKEKGYVLTTNRTSDFEKLVGFNKIIFGEDSDYNDDDFVFSMRELLQTAEEMGILDLISVKVDNETQAVGLGVFYNGRYYVLGVGRNKEIKNMGKLLIAEQIKSAVKHECDEIDFLSAESNWKELWNLESEQMYEYHDKFIEP